MRRRFDSPALSVLMSVYNAARYLDEAITSIRNQGFQDFEFLIVDDGSTDETADIISRHAEADSRIIARRQPNRGLIASLNLLLGQARAPVVARMDADDIAHPDRFARQLAFLEKQPEVVLVGTQIGLIDAHGHALPQTRRLPLPHADIMKVMGHSLALAHSSAMMRTHHVQSLGGYRAAFRHCEDLDLWLRLSAVGKIANLPETLMRYRIHPAQVSQAHVLDQATNAAIALLLHEHISLGGPDPLAGHNIMPSLEHLAAALGRNDLPAKVRARVAARLIHEPAALDGPALNLLVTHMKEASWEELALKQIGAAILRLVRAGRPYAAWALAMAFGQRVATP